MNFKHYIITRFNVNIWPMPFEKRLEDTWLSQRFDLFQKFCFPTLQAQTNQEFTWLVLFDRRTPLPYQRIIQAYSKYPNFVALLCDEWDTVMPTAKAYIKENSPEADWILTTRLDNDDALSCKYVDSLHRLVATLTTQQFGPDKTLYINFTKGLQYCQEKFYDFADVTNAFVSLIEPKDFLKTVFWVDHPAIYSVSPVLQAQTPPLWLQVIHDINVYNYIRGEEVDASALLSNFKCDFN
ncbi:glycosyltransferase [Maridesulfovibrio zosterae]|uniref:glycosyltransferase n=1 Tax=Maridesulfovibrio zosterae TaxID=82171 RepID=UPI00041E9E0E|nr:glycosyltransferase [Maridesulfovibrio zosterae]